MKYDAIVIGSGINGLITTALLAQKKLNVLCLEKNEEMGGLASSRKIFTEAESYPLVDDTSVVDPKIVKQLQLEKYGLEFYQPLNEVGCYFAKKNTPGFYWLLNSKACYEEIKTYCSHQDAEGYLRFNELVEKTSPFVQKICNDQLPDLQHLNLSTIWKIGTKAARLRMLGKKPMVALLRSLPMCVADFLNEYFVDPELKACLALHAVKGNYLGPWSPGTAANLLLWQGRSQFKVRGGAQALKDALLKCIANSNHAKIQLGSEVKKFRLKDRIIQAIELANGETLESTKVFSTLDTQQTFNKFVQATELDQSFNRHLSHVRFRGTMARIEYLSTKLKLKNSDSRTPTHITIAPSMDDVEKAFDPVKYNEFSQNPVLELQTKTINDTTDLLSVDVHFVPYLKNSDWSAQQKEQIIESVSHKLNEYFDGFHPIKSHLTTPNDIEGQFGISGGHLYHGEVTLDQLICRPTPETSAYKTPIQNLILTGNGCHPVGRNCGTQALLAIQSHI